MMDLYGFDPADWDAESLTIEVRFARAPTEEEARALGKLWAKVRAQETGSWEWSGPFALFWVTPWPHRERQMLERLASLPGQLRPTVVEAIHLSAGETLPPTLRPLRDPFRRAVCSAR